MTYTGLIQACLDSGHIQDGTYIFSKMQNFCSPNLVTCNIMLKAYLLHGMFEEAKDLFHKMSENGNYIGRKSDYRVQVIPDIYTFNIMLDACIAEERWDDFENIYRRLLHNGYHFNAKRHLRMILDASRAGKVFPSLLSYISSHGSKLGLVWTSCGKGMFESISLFTCQSKWSNLHKWLKIPRNICPRKPKLIFCVQIFSLSSVAVLSNVPRNKCFRGP